MENAFLAGLKGLFDGLHQFFKEAAGGNDFGAGGQPLSGIDEHQFDIRGKAKLASAAFAQGENTRRAKLMSVGLRGAVSGSQFGITMLKGGIDYHLGQVGKFAGKIPKLLRIAKYMAHIDAEHFAVFEGIDRLTPIGRPRQGMGQLAFKLGFVEHGLEHVHVAHDGEEVGILHAQKIIPEKITHSQQAGQAVEHFGLVDLGQLIRPVGAFEKLGQKFTKMQQGGLGVGAIRQKVSKVFDEHRGGTQLALLFGADDLLAAAVGDKEGIADAAAHGFNLHADDVDVVQGERVAELVEEADRVGGADLERGVTFRDLVIDLDVDGVERSGFCCLRLEGGGDPFGQFALRLAALSGEHFFDEAQKIFSVIGPESSIDRFGMGGLHHKDIHDLLAHRGGRSRVRLVGEGIALEDIQSVQEHQPADDRELAEIVITDDGDAPTGAGKLSGVDDDWGLAAQFPGKLGMAADLGFTEGDRVRRIHVLDVFL